MVLRSNNISINDGYSILGYVLPYGQMSLWELL